MIAQQLENLYIYKNQYFFTLHCFIEWFYLTDAWAKAVADSYKSFFNTIFT
jgi:hypothetical protein